jgi:hypothetical protein
LHLVLGGMLSLKILKGESKFKLTRNPLGADRIGDIKDVSDGIKVFGLLIKTHKILKGVSTAITLTSTLSVLT